MMDRIFRTLDLREKAAAGARYLDMADPGWYEKVSRGKLDLSSNKHCILGQLHGSFTKGCANLGLNNEAAEPRGFLFFGIDQEVPYKELTCAWREEISKRLAPAPVVEILQVQEAEEELALV